MPERPGISRLPAPAPEGGLAALFHETVAQRRYDLGKTQAREGGSRRDR